MTVRSPDEKLSSLKETIADIALTVGALISSQQLKDLEKVGGSRGLVEWIIGKAEAFEEVYGGVEWGIEEGFGEYMEVVDEYTYRCLKDRGLMVTMERKAEWLRR